MEDPPQRNTEKSIPEEILDEIIRSVPIKDLPNIMLSSQTLYRLAKPHFYRSLYYFGGGVDHLGSDFYLEGTTRMDCVPDHHNFALSPEIFSACGPANSARVIRLAEFLRTITENSEMLSYINEVSLSTGSIDQKGDVKETEAEKVHLSILTLITLNLAFTSTVTSIDVVYPGKDTYNRHEYDPLLRDQVHCLFKIPSLRHLCLRKARTWRDFNPISPNDNAKIRTSNVVSLSLLDTVPMDTDLQEILTVSTSKHINSHMVLHAFIGALETNLEKIY